MLCCDGFHLHKLGLVSVSMLQKTVVSVQFQKKVEDKKYNDTDKKINEWQTNHS